MRKLFSFLIIVALAIVVFAFLPVNDAKKDGVDTPSYEIAKQKFYDAFLKYKSDLQNGIIAAPPVDPSGYFKVDENGNMNMTNGEPVTESVKYEPKLSADVVATYAFTQSTTTYTSINGTGTMIPGSTNCDDNTYGPLPIGFNFTYNGTVYTTFGVCCNGFLNFPTGVFSYAPISSTTSCISPFGQDLQMNTTGAIYYQTSGSAPNRICTIEFYQAGFWPTSGNELSFEIKLFETTNAVQIIYQTGAHTSTNVVQCGINGATTADFSNRTTTTSWASTTSGATNAATCSFSLTIYPASGLTFQWAPPAPPAVPTLLTPANHRIDMPLSGDTISWTASGGATNYNLVISLDSLGTTVVYSDTTLTGVAYIFSGFGPLTNWWWKVRAKNAIGWSAFTIPWVFRTKGPATQVTLITPANNATNQPIAFTHNWSRAVDQTFKPHGITCVPVGQNTNVSQKSQVRQLSPEAITNYWYELYTDTTLTAVIKDSTLTDTTRAVSGLLNNQNYWWRVKAKNDVGWGPFSVYFKFTTVVAVPPAPTNIYPGNGATGIIPTTLIKWSNSAGATQYRLQVSTDPTFTTTQFDTTIAADSIFVPPGRLLNNTLYNWHVRAQNAGGNSAYTGNWTFTTSLVGITSNGTQIPKLFKLYEAYPNPFNPATVIKFDLPVSGAVKMEIFNLLGQEVATLINGNYAAGSYSVRWDAADFSSGIYFYRITSGNFTDIRKMVLIK